MVTVLAATLGVVSLAACEPMPPPPVLVVTTTTTGSDADPGNGTCEVTPGAGDCSLRAALEEGSALGRADITVPDGLHTTGVVTVDGSLRVNPEGNQVSLEGSTITVAAGASLVLVGVDALDENGEAGSSFDSVVVEGTLVLLDSWLFQLGKPVVTVGPEGTAVLDTTNLMAGFSPVVDNQGTLVVRRSTLAGVDGAALKTSGAGRSVVEGSLLYTRNVRFGLGPVCLGTAPESMGFVASTDATCAVTGPTDQQDVAVTIGDFPSPPAPPLPTSPLIDAIPAGSPACPAADVDVVGTSRPIDGDGDGVAACDIGAVERPAA